MSATSNTKTEKVMKKNGLFSFLREVKAEVKRITWPSKDETKKALIAVVIFTLIYIMLVGGLDFIFKNLFKIILNLK
jgi:preprotein translocase subunit SecE